MITPTEALASSGNASTISKTAGIETPGKPVLASPMSIAAALPSK